MIVLSNRIHKVGTTLFSRGTSVLMTCSWLVIVAVPLWWKAVHGGHVGVCGFELLAITWPWAQTTLPLAAVPGPWTVDWPGLPAGIGSRLWAEHIGPILAPHYHAISDDALLVCITSYKNTHYFMKFGCR